MKKTLIILILFQSWFCYGQSIRITRLLAKDNFNTSSYTQFDKNIRLNYEKTHIQIFFQDSSAIAASYQIRLLGFEKNWQNVEKQTYANYINLLGGEYEFQVRNIQFSDKITSIKFHIEEAFWQQTWFIPAIIAYFLLITGIILYFFQLNRFRQHNRLQQIRNDISADLHDDIGSTLSNISFLTEIAKTRIKTKPDEVPMILDKILEDSKEMVQTMRGMIWTINPSNDNANDFFGKVENLINEMTNAYQIRAEFDCKLPDNQKVNLEFQRNVFLVFKEAIHNVIKYAAAENIKITIRKESNWLMIQLKDDGIGFDENIESDGNGLRNMKNRIEQLGGNFEVKGNDGTRLRMLVPLT